MRERGEEAGSTRAVSELVVRLSPEDVNAIAVALADELERRALVSTSDGRQPEPLLSLEEFASELAGRMPGRSRRQWAKWLYEHAPRGDVPRARKVGGRWWFLKTAADELVEARSC